MISSFERIKSQLNSAVMMARRIHLFPFRTQKLSFVTPRVVRGTPLARVGNRRAVCGSSSVVEHHLAMVGVAGSNPVFRLCSNDGTKDTPVPIPNTEVKLRNAESS